MADETSIYRVRIADRGASTVSGNVALTLDVDHFVDIPSPGGQAVKPLKGEVSDSPYTLSLIDPDEEITAEFGDSDRPAMLSRLISLERSDDDGDNWSVEDVGRISSFGEGSGPGKYDVQVSSENWSVRRSRMFQRTKSIQLLPYGLTHDWGPPGAVTPAVGSGDWSADPKSETEVVQVAFTRARQRINAQPPAELAPVVLQDVSARENIVMTTGSGGNFRSLRFTATHVNDSAITEQTLGVIRLGATKPGDTGARNADPETVLGSFFPSSEHSEELRLEFAWLSWPGHGLSQGDTVRGRLEFIGGDGLPVGEHAPYYVGGTDGEHVGQILVDALEGEYGGSTARLATTERTDILGADLPLAWLRQTSPVDRGQWLNKNIQRPFQILPLTDPEDGLRLLRLWLPQDLDPDTLDLLDSDNAQGHTWDNLGRESLNRIAFKWRTVAYDREVFEGSEDGEPVEGERVDGMIVGDVTYEAEGDSFADDLGDRDLEFSSDMILELFEAEDWTGQIGGELLDIYQDGPILRRLRAKRIDLDLVSGDLVRLDCEDLGIPNPVDEARTGQRVARVLEVEKRPAEYRITLLDFGPKLQPLSAPTVSVAQDTDEDYVEVTVSGLSSTATVEIAHAATSSTPDDDAFTQARAGLANGDHRFFLRKSGGFVHARAKTVDPLRIRSAWANDNASLATRALISDVRVSVDDLTATVIGVAGSDTSGVRIYYDTHDPGSEPDFSANTEDFSTSDFEDGSAELSTDLTAGQMISAVVEPYTGFSGGSVSGDAGPEVSVSWGPRTSRAERFTGSNPVFTHTVDIRGGEGGTRIFASASGALGGIWQFYDSNGDFAGSVYGGLDSDGNLVIQASGGKQLRLWGDNDVIVQGEWGYDPVDYGTSGGTENNVSLPAEAAYVSVTGSTDVTFTGIAGGWKGRRLFLHNDLGAGNNLTLNDNSGSSSSGNRFWMKTGNLILGPGEVGEFVYNGLHWHQLGDSA